MEFKQLELKQDSNWFKRKYRSKHFRKSVLFTLGGGLVGFLLFYFTEGQNLNSMSGGDIFNNVFMGAFLGFFITNSPCARGRC